MWAESVMESIWSDSINNFRNYGEYFERCMNDPDKYSGGREQWHIKYSLTGYADS